MLVISWGQVGHGWDEVAERKEVGVGKGRGWGKGGVGWGGVARRQEVLAGVACWQGGEALLQHGLHVAVWGMWSKGRMGQSSIGGFWQLKASSSLNQRAVTDVASRAPSHR